MSTAARWRVYDTPPASGAHNMAMDQALMESVRAGRDPVLRFYRWSPACLSLGRNQPADGWYDERKLREHGIDVVRRPTGGRAVLHDRELTYSAAFPTRMLGSPRAAYAAVNRALVGGLRRLGVSAEPQPALGHRAAPPSLSPCFRDPAEGEVVIGGRKLVGSAQYREAGVILQHGSLLIGDDQSSVSELLIGGAASSIDRPATLAEHLDPLPTWAELVAALVAGWEQELGAAPVAGAPDSAERARASELESAYRETDWTWRRAAPPGWHGPGIEAPRPAHVLPHRTL